MRSCNPKRTHPAPPSPTARTLGDLYPLSRLREWHETCGRSHASFGAKVAELGALFQGLRRDVEALFMQVGGKGGFECETGRYGGFVRVGQLGAWDHGKVERRGDVGALLM